VRGSSHPKTAGVANVQVRESEPSELLITLPAVTRSGDLTAILFGAGRMLARDQAEKAGNLPHVVN